MNWREFEYQNLNDKRLIIILDSCRYDIFEKIIREYNFEYNLDKRKSYGNYTRQFYDNIPNLSNKIIVTANPYPFYKRNKFKNVVITSSINPNDNIIEYSNVKNKYKNDEFMLHLIPPHIPWIGKEGSKLYNEFMNKLNLRDARNKLKTERHFGPMGIEGMVYRHYGKEISIKYYKENLKVALDAINNNSDLLPAEFIITADHGELFGEYNLFGHTEGQVTPDVNELRIVPWCLIKNE